MKGYEEKGRKEKKGKNEFVKSEVVAKLKLKRASGRLGDYVCIW